MAMFQDLLATIKDQDRDEARRRVGRQDFRTDMAGFFVREFRWGSRNTKGESVSLKAVIPRRPSRIGD